MEASKYRLLNFVHCLAYLYGINDRTACHIIKNGSKAQRNGLKTKLAYQLHVSKRALYMVSCGNLAPLGRILWACSKCVHDIPSLKWCLGAERRASGTTEAEMLNGTPYQIKSFDLNNMPKISVQSLSQIASNIHAPVITLVHTFRRSGITVNDKVGDLPILIHKTDPRIMLKNYLRCLSAVHGKPTRWLAGQLNLSYAKLINIIKTEQPSDVINHLRKLPEIFKGFSSHNITLVLQGYSAPLYKFVRKCIRTLRNRVDMINTISISARLFNVKIIDLAKQLQYSTNTLRTTLLECNSHQFMLMIAQLIHMLGMPVKLQQDVLKQAKRIDAMIPLPKALYFYVDYIVKPSKDPVVSPAFINREIQGQFQKALDSQNQKIAHNYEKEIINKLSKEFKFSSESFWKNNFKNIGNNIYLIQSHRAYPMNHRNWLKVLKALYTQLVVVNNMSEHLDNPKLISHIEIQGRRIKRPQRLIHLLTALQNHHEHFFTGHFDRTGIKVIQSTDDRHKEYYQPILVFDHIKYNHTPIMRQAIFNYTKNFVKLGHLYPGDLVKIQAMLSSCNKHYRLFSPQSAKLIRRIHTRTDMPVPSEIHALTGFAIINNKSGNYDFTTWGHNYGYVRYCKHQYRLWQQKQNSKGASKE